MMLESVESVESLGSPDSLGSPSSPGSPGSHGSLDSVLSNNKDNCITNKTTVVLSLLARFFLFSLFHGYIFNNVRVCAKVRDGMVDRQH